MTIHDLKVGDKLKVLVKTNSRGDVTLNDIIEITSIIPDLGVNKNHLWITHTPNSFSGGGFRIGDEGRHCYVLGNDVEYMRKKENYNYLIKLFKKLNIK